MSFGHVARNTLLRLRSRRCASPHVFCFSVRTICQVPEIHGRTSVDSFQENAIRPDKPLVLRVQENIDDSDPTAHSRDAAVLGATGVRGVPPLELTALTKWFRPETGLTPYLEEHAATFVEYELMVQPAGYQGPQPPVYEFIQWLLGSKNGMHNALGQLLEEVVSDSHYRPTQGSPRPRFLRFQAPLSLLAEGLKFNQQSVTTKLGELYIAQTPLTDLPLGLMADVPTPNLVKEAGKGQLYNSSIWMGLQSTYTPWHKDPNLNLFVQLCGVKTIRLCPPRAGYKLFLEVQNRLDTGSRGGSSSIRGAEMMEGDEREALHKAVWSEADDCPPNMYEASHLNPGDALFIPKEWWHSVQSVGPYGDLNASVNWWFR
ncbi:hypothetical protein OQA88_9998 [Cercophora sp. LCS_1]